MAPSFSAPIVAAVVAEAAVAALNRRAEQRGLGDNELAQLAAGEVLWAAGAGAAPGSRSVYRLNGSTAAFRAALQHFTGATAGGVPLPELLNMRNAVPAAWRRLPATFDMILWLGVTRLVDDLSAAAGGAARRQQQLAALRELQGALAKVMELLLQTAPADREVTHATAHADRKFSLAADAIGDDLPAILALRAAGA